ncbi:GNAT family N-acetyltransferase [Flavitalea sp. BT771]|uniref:GNAT family N-acetyltransferase n=1 Tax=Flavitalea sp. BT771 TaxID=3063329 RepID=UPI0026E2AA61|nr:GNAT family N-acetyltransferase [Flavitalea sp. BT771]MDO6431508.1 GNAT family N-acetyltransferase [Flavitalea sp. BT771]MDV6220416.1 GNAT family N-acetyltransferase [Flavitalea sp. BT771]
MQIITAIKDDYLITTDKTKLDVQFIHHFLSTEAYWSKDIPLDTVQHSIRNSLNFGVYHLDKQVGYARIVSDFATVAYLGDVFIIPAHRGKSLSKWLMEQVMGHPDLKGLRRWILLTRDAHALYSQYGWQSIASPDRWMEVHHPDVYTRGK